MHFIRAKKWVLLAVMLLAVSGSALAQFRLSITFGPPAIPVYEQPLCPGDGYIWTPGYWAWDDDAGDYYWVPGTWVMAPEVGYLWTPAWWGWDGGVYVWHAGYWGPHVGFYGGINYGFGYFGDGFWGGRWDHGHFFYNTSITRVNVTNIHNVYNEHVTINNNSHVSYNGGEGGLNARPTREQEEAMNEHHIEPSSAQREHEQQARSNPELRASANHGKPPIAATEKPGDFKTHVVEAKEAGGSYNHAPLKGGAAAGGEAKATNVGHVKDLPPTQHLEKPNTGDSKLDSKYQKQQDKLYAQQEKERTKLAAQQEKEHQQLDKQKANEQQKQQVEQKHQQQTQQLAQRHEQQRTTLQSHQSAPAPKKK